MADPLETMALWAEEEPFFLASALAAYARSEGLDAPGVAAALGCPVGDLAMLRLCRTPRTEPTEFWEDVTCIATRFGIDPQLLAGVVKRGQVVRRVLEPGPGTARPLMAARDREDEPPAETERP